jgi:TRAP-type C4-dicarboxylate transport system permease small subunit
MNFLNRLSNYIAFAEKGLIGTLLTVMIVLAFLQVILRNFFLTGILWVDPLLRHMVLWICFLGASIATQKKKHINIDVFSRLLSTKSKSAVNMLTNLFAAGVSYALMDASYKFILDEQEAQTVILTINNFEIISWWFQIIIPVGFGLMIFRFLINASSSMIQIIRPKPSVENN